MFHRHQNFLSSSGESQNKSAKKALGIILSLLRYWPQFLAVFLVLIILIGIFAVLSLAPYYTYLKAAYAFGMDGRTHLVSAESLIKTQKFKTASTELSSAEQSFSDAGKSLKFVEAAAIFRSKSVKNQLVVAEDIFFVGERLSHALSGLTDIGQEILTVIGKDNITFKDISIEQKRRMLGVIYSSKGDLETAQSEFNIVSQKMAEIDQLHPLFIFNKVVQPLQQEIPRIQEAFDGIVTAVKWLPAFAGYPQSKTYLIILENNRELRPAGGFIGTYGLLTVRDGEIKNLFTDNSYNLDFPSRSYLKIEPPEPIKTYLRQPKWFFRDSNWWPDFPTSAKKMQWFYEAEGGVKNVDGVIAFTPDLIEGMLGILGEFNVANIKFNQQNFWEQLEYQVEYGYYKQGIPNSQRKDIIKDLGEQIISRLYVLPMNQWPAVFALFNREMAEKQILLYFNDSRLQADALAKDWAGAVKPFGGDYLMLVDANMAALKTDAVMERTLSHSLTQASDGTLSAQTKVVYQNMGPSTWMSGRYRSYTRLYVPAGSQLVSVRVGNQEVKQVDIDVYNEFGKTAFGVFFEVDPLASQTVTWEYKLPANIVNKKYTLMVQKQPGLESLNVQLDINLNDQKIKQAEKITMDKIYQ